MFAWLSDEKMETPSVLLRITLSHVLLVAFGSHQGGKWGNAEFMLTFSKGSPCVRVKGTLTIIQLFRFSSQTQPPGGPYPHPAVEGAGSIQGS